MPRPAGRRNGQGRVWRSGSGCWSRSRDRSPDRLTHSHCECRQQHRDRRNHWDDPGSRRRRRRRYWNPGEFRAWLHGPLERRFGARFLAAGLRARFRMLVHNPADRLLVEDLPDPGFERDRILVGRIKSDRVAGARPRHLALSTFQQCVGHLDVGVDGLPDRALLLLEQALVFDHQLVKRLGDDSSAFTMIEPPQQLDRLFAPPTFEGRPCRSDDIE
jgi:hypothetical protein